MKTQRIIINLLGILLASHIYSQSTPKDFVGLSLDTVNRYAELKLDSTDVKPQIKRVSALSPRSYGGELHPTIPNFYHINRSKAVGDIPYSSSVTPLGAFTLNVPIEVCPSPNGFTPQISLSYNSMGGNGALGIGWSISGTSTISRVNKSFHYDGKVESLKYYGADGAYCLDGQRLIKTGQTATQIVFQSEQGHIKVVGTHYNNAISSFQVFYPDGKKAIYGGASAYDGITYYLKKVTNKEGRDINYTYTSVGGHYRLSKITYGASGKASVDFNYTTTTRSDVQEIFNAGIKQTIDYLLSSVTTSLNGTIQRTYSLSYATKGKVSAVSRIELTAFGNSLNPLIMYYGDSEQSHSFDKQETQLAHWYNFTAPGQLRVVKGKFDYGTENDGIIVLPNKLHMWEYYKHGTAFRKSQNFLGNDYIGDETIIISTGLSGPLGMYNPQLKTEAGFVDIFCMDLDQYKGEEIVKVNNTLNGNYDRVQFHVYTPNLYSGISKKYTRTYDFNSVMSHNGDKSLNPKQYFTGDFNGDGKMEVLIVTANNMMGKGFPTICYLIDLEANRILYQASPFTYNLKLTRGGSYTTTGEEAYKMSDKLFAIDFDGDGKTDICRITDSGTYIYTFQTSGNTITCNQVAFDSQFQNSTLYDREFFAGEFNGDGKTDFILSPTVGGGSTWSIFSSKGNGYFDKKNINITTNTQYSRFIVQDMNSDGQTDLIETYGSGSTLSLYTYFIADRAYKGSASSSVAGETVLIPTNIQSRNYYSKLISLQTGGKACRIGYKNDDSKNRLLTTFITSYGIVSKIGYRQINDENYNVYSSGSDASFPYHNYYGALTVVSNMVSYNNSVLVSDNSYHYTNAVIHKQGLGFRGFDQIRVNDNMSGNYYMRTFDPLRYSVLTREETREKATVYNYNVAVASNKTVKATVASKTETDKLKNFSVTSTYTYDTYGNVLTENVNYGGGLSATRTNTYQNVNTDTTYILGLPLTQQMTKTRSGVSHTTRAVITYTPTYMIETKKEYIGTGANYQVKQEEYEYEDNNLTGFMSKSYSARDFSWVRYAYDDDGYLKLKTPCTGLETYYEYNSRGELFMEKTSKGYSTYYEYDFLGRKTRTTYPDGTAEIVTFEWTTEPAGALLLMKKTAPGHPEERVYMDALGREIRTGVKRYDGTFVYTDKVYDWRGRLEKVSLPFKGSPGLWNSYTYDPYDRIASINYASGKRDLYVYTGMSETSTIDGVSRTKTYNTMGEVISITDPAGTITYNYRPDGKFSSVVAPGGCTTSFTYDTFGRQTSITDPSAGTKTVTYDAAGNVNRETDATGKVINYTYDTHNRLITKEVVGVTTTTYSYGSRDGRLLSEVSTNGTSKIYTYDNLLRLSTEKETGADGKWLQKTYNYVNGNISTISYLSHSGSICTENYVYANGSLAEIKLNNNTTIWKITGENEWGLPVSAITGPLTRTYSYDAYGLPTGRGAQYGNTVIQNYGYNFLSATGNLKWRKDNTRGLQEDFSYDDQNRLTTFGGKTITYDAKGNITDYSTVGRFTYSQARPYAIESVTPYGNSIPLRAQNITYNALMRPETISENGYVATLTYNGNGDRVKMQLRQNGTDKLIRWYIGQQYETDQSGTTVTERLYVGGDAYSAPAVYIKSGAGSWGLYYICRDYLGSITHVVNSSGSVVQELSYDPWGRLRNPANHAVYAPGSEPELFLGRGYTGHEHLTAFGLINMNARLYDPALGRFLSPDPYVQAPEMSQNFNRYSYALNNPLRYTDPNGEFIFSAFLGPLGAILDGICWGAVIGAGTSAVAYSVGAAITGNWSWSNFGSAIGMGALGGAIGGGFSALGGIGVLGSFGNTMGYSVLSQAASSVTTNAIFGNDITWGSVAGMIAGGVMGSVLPQFNAVKGGAFKNAVSEIGFSTGRGALTGTVSGLVQAGIDKDPRAILRNMLGGAMNGASTSLLTIATFGPAVNFDDSYIRPYGTSRSNQPIYRTGGIASLFNGKGISFGRTAWANGRTQKGIFLDVALIHEGTHWYQQQEEGFSTFYGMTLKNYTRSLFANKGKLTPLYYGKYLPGNYEHIAFSNEYNKLKLNFFNMLFPFCF